MLVYDELYVTPTESVYVHPCRIPAIRNSIEEGKRIRLANSVSPSDKEHIIFDGGIDYKQDKIANSPARIAYHKAKGQALIRYRGELYQYAIAQ